MLTRIALFFIACYQRLISPVIHALVPGSGCRFEPTCSHYAAEALKKHGFFKGGWLAFQRILRCNPFHPGGHDPVPPHKESQCCKPKSEASPLTHG